MKEIWKTIPEYEDYEVSNLGRVKSHKKWNDGKQERFLKPKLENTGYLKICLNKNNKTKYFYIHRLVLLCFIGKNKFSVNHKNGIKTDNKLTNLEYATHSENMKHSFKMGLHNLKGEKNTQAKLNGNQVVKIRKMYKTKKYYQRDIAKIFKVDRKTISDIVLYKSWNYPEYNISST